MSEPKENDKALRPWIVPTIIELDVRDTSALPGSGADVGGNPFPDDQHS